MTREKLIFEAEVKTGNSANSIKSVRAELRELKQQMAGLDPSSAEFVKAAQRAGALQDAIEDVNNTIRAFNPEQKFQAFAGVLGGVANGFSVVQGAMALMGTESKEVEQAILKTQAAIAIATGVNGLLGMKDAFIILSNVIKTQVVAAFATMRAAIISTGILGLVTLIGTLIYSWYENKKATEDAEKALRDYNDAVKRTSQEIQDLSVELLEGRQREAAAISNETTKKLNELAKRAADIRQKASEEGRELTKAELHELKSITQQQQLVYELGEKKQRELNKKWAEEDKKLRKEAKERLRQYGDTYAQLEVELKTGRERELAELKRETEAKKQQIEKQINDKVLTHEQGEKLKRLVLEIEDKKLKELQQKWSKEDEEKLNQKIEKETELELKKFDALITIRRTKGLENVQALDELYQLEQQRLDMQLERNLISIEEYNAKSLELEQQNSNAKIQLTQAEYNAKMNMLSAYGNALQGFAQLAGEQTAVGKALAVAQTTIDTYVNATKAYKAALDVPMGGVFLAPIAAAGAVAAGLANVRRIMSVQVPNTNISIPASVGGGQAAPQLPPSAQGFNINGANSPLITRNIVTEGNRVYVLESDITDVQGRVSDIKKKARVR